MVAFAIIIAILLVIALLRFGVSAQYGADGIIVAAFVGPFTLSVYPKSDRPRRARKKRTPKEAKEPKAKKQTDAPKPGGLKEYLEMLPVIRNTLGRLRRRLLVKSLDIHLAFASDDPSKTAIAFGAANATIGTILPIFENAFRIKHRDVRLWADFEAMKPVIFVRLSISIAIWEVFYIAFALLPLITASRKKNNMSK